MLSIPSGSIYHEDIGRFRSNASHDAIKKSALFIGEIRKVPPSVQISNLAGIKLLELETYKTRSLKEQQVSG